MIPNKIHQIYIDPIPDETLARRRQWADLHPAWDCELWQREGVAKLPFSGQFVDWQPRAFVADLARLEILYLYGGVYIDCDVEPNPQRPLTELQDNDLLLCREHKGKAIFNGFLGAEARHPVVGLLLARAVAVALPLLINPERHLNTPRWLPNFTGPHALKRWLNEAQLHPKEILDIPYEGPNSHCVMIRNTYIVLGKHLGENAWKDKPICPSEPLEA